MRNDVENTLKTKCVFENDKIIVTQILDRKEFVDLKKYLGEYGISWNKKAEAFVGDTAVIRQLRDYLNGNGEKPVSDKEMSFFETPAQLVEKMVDLVGLDTDYVFRSFKILEPSAGRGAIIDRLRRNFLDENIYLVEKEPRRAEYLRRNYQNVHCGDFLSYSPDVRFDFIFMNPPFNKTEYIKHVLHAKELLAPGGTIVAVTPYTFIDRVSKGNAGKEERDLFEDLAMSNDGVPIFDSMFEGTDIGVAVFRIDNFDAPTLQKIQAYEVHRFVVEFVNEQRYYTAIEKSIAEGNVKEVMANLVDEKLRYVNVDKETGIITHLYPHSLRERYIEGVMKYYELDNSNDYGNNEEVKEKSLVRTWKQKMMAF